MNQNKFKILILLTIFAGGVFVCNPNIVLGEEEQMINLIINELMPNPEGSDKEGEWIEIKNLSSFEINLNGWAIEDESSKKYIFGDEVIGANEFLVLKYERTKISLNNDRESISLISPNNQLASKIAYFKEAKEGLSFSRKEKNNWQWVEIATPGKENIFPNNSSDDIKGVVNNTASREEQGKQGEQGKKDASLEGSINDNGGFDNIFNQTRNVIGLAIFVGLIFGISGAILTRKYLSKNNNLDTEED